MATGVIGGRMWVTVVDTASCLHGNATLPHQLFSLPACLTMAFVPGYITKKKKITKFKKYLYYFIMLSIYFSKSNHTRTSIKDLFDLLLHISEFKLGHTGITQR